MADMRRDRPAGCLDLMRSARRPAGVGSHSANSHFVGRYCSVASTVADWENWRAHV